MGFLSSQLYRVTPSDPITLFAAVAAMLLITLITVSMPALRASRIDPMVALRHD